MAGMELGAGRAVKVKYAVSLFSRVQVTNSGTGFLNRSTINIGDR